MKYTDFPQGEGCEFIKRFKGLIIRYKDNFGEDVAQNMVDNISGENLDRFYDSVVALFIFAGPSAFYHYKRGLIDLLIWANKNEKCAEADKKIKCVAKISKGKIWLPDGELSAEFNKPEFIKLKKFSATARQQVYRKEIDVESDRFYVASPKHLLYLLDSCYGDAPDSMCAAICFLWLGISVSDSIKLKKTDVAEDCSACTFNGRTLLIEEPFASYLCVYKNNDKEFSPEKNSYFTRYKESEYFLERSVFARTMTTVKQPIGSSMIYSKLTAMNIAVSQKMGMRIMLSCESIKKSATYYDAYRIEKKTSIPVSESILSKVGGSQQKLYEHMVTYPMWLKTYQEVVVEHPEFE